MTLKPPDLRVIALQERLVGGGVLPCTEFPLPCGVVGALAQEECIYTSFGHSRNMAAVCRI